MRSLLWVMVMSPGSFMEEKHGVHLITSVTDEVEEEQCLPTNLKPVCGVV